MDAFALNGRNIAEVHTGALYGASDPLV